MSAELLPWREIERLLLAFSFDPAQLDFEISDLFQGLNWRKSGSLFRQSSGYVIGSPTEFFTLYVDPTELIRALSDYQFRAVIIFTEPNQSPYALAYFAYLAKIPIRIGQSCEFGGSLLSHSIKPPTDRVSTTAYHRHLLDAIGWLDAVSSIPF
jgi:hypothetical protein